MGESQQLEKRIKDMEMIGYAIGYKAGHTQNRNERDRLNAQHFTPGDAAPLMPAMPYGLDWQQIWLTSDRHFGYPSFGGSDDQDI